MAEDTIYKQPPYSAEAEASVLGCMLLDRECAASAFSLLSDEDFYIGENRAVYAAMMEIAGRNQTIDIVSVLERLQAEENEAKRVPMAYLADLTQGVVHLGHIEEHCRIVYEKSAMRRLIAGFSELIADCYASALPLGDIIEKAERFIYAMSTAQHHSDFVSLREAIVGTLAKLSELYQSDDALSGVPTGFTALDSITNGLQRSDLIVLAARPSMGKTALGLNIAQNAAIRYGKVAAFFSLEMSAEQLVMRVISSEADISNTALRIGLERNDHWSRVIKLNSELTEKQVELYIDDTSAISVGEMRSKLRKLKSRVGLDLAVIDYLQLMSASERTDNRNQEISAITRQLKAIAKELDIPMLCLSQLSRSPEGRKDRRPILSDLRESGAIEQDADIVMMLYRENYYDRELQTNETEVIFAKHRNGPVGTVKLLFSSEFTKFKDLDYTI
ncbi:MAG: replicative DNA helicase [Eubacteriaceae bacterium]|nr:replicative DNA helicase [Eubacteriaceae bacterium]